jgi:Lrp/AsnC family leucine-responsive transcriptional regulator
MKDLDKLILDILKEDAKITNLELSKKIGLSPSSTLERVKKLENEGIIKGYYIRVSEEKLGLTNKLFIRIKLYNNVSKDKIEEFINHLKKLEKISRVHQLIGNRTFIIKANFENLKTYNEFIDKIICKFDFIKTVKSDIVVKTIK